MSRGEEKAAVNAFVLREALRARIAGRYKGRANPAPEEGTTGWYEAAADIADVASTTVKKLLKGEPVTASVLLTLLDRLQLSAVDLVSLDDQCRLPKSPEAYAALRHGYFISDLRSTPGKPARRWCHEDAEIRAELGPGEALRLEGTLTNEFDVTFDVRGDWIGPYLMTMTAFVRCGPPQDDLHHAITCAFTSIFNLCYPLRRLQGQFADDPGHVLCGFWQGLTCFGTPAAYRFFLSPHELSPDDRRRLKKELKTMVFIDVDEGY